MFISRLNCLDGIKISRFGEIETLKQQDYSGKQVFILIEDAEKNQVRSKIDLGVHNRFELEQEEYCFDIAYDDEGASLLINSNEQMMAEKMRSLLKFGPFSTRYKDVYDMYYLNNFVDREKLIAALDTYIFSDEKMRENSGSDIAKRLKKTFNDKGYIQRLDISDKRWIDTDVDVITKELVEFVDVIC